MDDDGERWGEDEEMWDDEDMDRTPTPPEHRYEEMSEEEKLIVRGLVAETYETAQERGCTCSPRINVYIPGIPEDLSLSMAVGVKLVHDNLCHGLLRQRAQEGRN